MLLNLLTQELVLLQNTYQLMYRYKYTHIYTDTLKINQNVEDILPHKNMIFKNCLLIYATFLFVAASFFYSPGKTTVPSVAP